MLKADLGISDQTFRNWESGYCEPDDETKRAVINQCAEAITGKTIY
jgi:DNA-binding transcriptional regulator YiaG